MVGLHALAGCLHQPGVLRRQANVCEDGAGKSNVAGVVVQDQRATTGGSLERELLNGNVLRPDLGVRQAPLQRRDPDAMRRGNADLCWVSQGE